MNSNYTGILLLMISLFSSPYPAHAEESLMASGCSVSTVAYLSDLARAYEKETGKQVLVRGGGSLLGLTDLHATRVDFAASCKGKSPGDPSDFEFIPVAWDALVFIVNKSNPISNIKPDDVRLIYEGKITNWKQLGGLDLNVTSFISTPQGMGGIGEALSKMILDGKLPEKQANSSMQASSVAIWEQMVEKTPEGFASTGFGSARKRKVKMLSVNGVAPSKKNIMSGKYPFKRPLYLTVKKDAKPDVRKFIEFVLSKKGQGLISSYGIPSLADIK
jgi:phosphate transport system substrate-binding protein